MTEVRFETKDAERFFKEAPRKIFNAERSAVRTTTTFARKELLRRISAATGLPRKVFSVYRLRRRDLATKGLLWLGMRPVKAKFAGRLRQEDYGASAGKYYWEGAFVANTEKRGRSVFKRATKRRIPIVEQVVDLPGTVAAATEEVRKLSQIELQRRFVEALEKRLK